MLSHITTLACCPSPLPHTPYPFLPLIPLHPLRPFIRLPLISLHPFLPVILPTLSSPSYPSTLSSPSYHSTLSSPSYSSTLSFSADTLYTYHPIALQDPRVPMLIQYVMKVEKTMFEAATSQEEYYQLLAEKTDWVRKMLVERRRMNSAVAKKFLLRTRVKNEVKNEVKRRVRMGGQ